MQGAALSAHIEGGRGLHGVETGDISKVFAAAARLLRDELVALLVLIGLARDGGVDAVLVTGSLQVDTWRVCGCKQCPT